MRGVRRRGLAIEEDYRYVLLIVILEYLRVKL